MNEKILPSPSLHTLFVSHEVSHCPLISEMITLGKSLQPSGLLEKETGVLSLDYGNRLLINAKNVDVKKMTQQDIVEIVDYDPLKNIMMVIGPKEPALQTPEHWIIQKARRDIMVLLQMNNTVLYEKFHHTFPMTEKETKPGTLERAKEILKTLRNGKIIVLKNEGILIAGLTIKETQDALATALGGKR
jgi:hypothetical protein